MPAGTNHFEETFIVGHLFLFLLTLSYGGKSASACFLTIINGQLILPFAVDLYYVKMYSNQLWCFDYGKTCMAPVFSVNIQTAARQPDTQFHVNPNYPTNHPN